MVQRDVGVIDICVSLLAEQLFYLRLLINLKAHILSQHIDNMRCLNINDEHLRILVLLLSCQSSTMTDQLSMGDIECSRYISKAGYISEQTFPYSQWYFFWAKWINEAMYIGCSTLRGLYKKMIILFKKEAVRKSYHRHISNIHWTIYHVIRTPLDELMGLVLSDDYR